MKTLSSFKYLWFIFGSSKNTSSPAPYIFFFSNTSRSEFSSITDPLEILIKIPFLPRNFDINSLEMNIDNFKVDAVASGFFPFTKSENLYLDYSFVEEVFKVSFLDDFKDPFSISFDDKGSVSAINGSLKPKVGAGYHINFFDNQVFIF